MNEYALCVIFLRKSIVNTLVPRVALPNPTLTIVAVEVSAVSVVKYIPPSSETTIEVSFSDLSLDEIFLFIAKDPVVSTDAIKAS